MGDEMNHNRVLDRALTVLNVGGVLLYPTDTIWGIGCDATNADAVEKIYALKQRDHSKSMLMLCSDLAMVERYVGMVGERARELLMSEDRPTTVILPVVCSLLACNLMASDGTVGVRIPRMDFCQQLLRGFGKPVVSTSANFSGRPSPSSHGEIDRELFGRVDYAVPGEYEEATSCCGSRIVKVGSDGGIIVIRG